jgi:hypothetical protein
MSAALLNVYAMDMPSEMTAQGRQFEVVMTVPRLGGSVPLMPRELPDGVFGAWGAVTVTISATVTAAGAGQAVAAVEAIVPDLARADGITVQVHAPTEAERLKGEQALAFFMEKAASATPEQRERAEGALARIEAHSAQIEP